MKRPIIYLAVTLGILAGLAGCTADQLAPYRTAASATTQMASDPVVQTAFPMPAAVASLVGNAVLMMLLGLENAKKRQAQKASTTSTSTEK
jgi:hypothetical protein